jgi:dUTP pyrophosphatase
MMFMPKMKIRGCFGPLEELSEEKAFDLEVVDKCFVSNTASHSLIAVSGIQELQVKIKKIKDSAILPEYKTAGSAGMDLCAAIDEPMILDCMDQALICTGVAIELPLGFEAQVRTRSGLAWKKALVVLNSPGTIDSDYRGEIMVMLINLGPMPVSIQPNERIAQLVVSRHEKISWVECSDLDSTERGAGGLGSTGSM